MKKIALPLILFLFISGLGILGAQEKTGVPVVVAGVLHVLQYTNADKEGSTFDHALSWKESPDRSGVYSLIFSDFRYTYLFDTARLSYAQKDAYRRVILNGKLTCDASGRLNGTLSVGGETELSSLSFENLSAWESSETGGITADGVSYTQAEITQIIEDMDYNFDPRNVITWEMECIFAGFAALLKSADLKWENGEGVLDSLMDGQPPAGERISAEDGKISALAKKDGIVEFAYKDFPVDTNDEYFPFTMRGNVSISATQSKEENDSESLTFNGSFTVKGLSAFSRAELKNFTLSEMQESADSMGVSGSVVIDGKEYQGTEVFRSLMRWFH
jgi:hypothetical protein